MTRTELWRSRVLTSALLLSCMGCESTTEVGSECRHGVCPQASAATSLACIASAAVMEVAVTRAADEDLADVDARLGAVCLPRVLPTSDSGLVACRVLWSVNEHPSDGGFDDAGNLVPAAEPWDGSCDAPFLEPAGAGDPAGACVVQQTTASDAAVGDGDGWFMDTALEDLCGGAGGAGLVFTPAASVPSGAVIHVACSCTQAVGTDGELFDVDPSECGRPPAGIASDVGAACLPPLPEGGFDDREIHLETFSQQCESGACMVFHLLGDPSADCDEGVSLAGPRCADPSEVDKRAYCSCRCSVPEGDDSEPCECPDGFTCVDDVIADPPGLAGGYCVHDGTFTLP